MNLPTEYNLGFNEARRLHSLSYLSLQSDFCYEHAAENYQTSLQMAIALRRIKEYDGAIQLELVEVYHSQVNSTKRLLRKLHDPKIMELADMLDHVQGQVSQMKTI